MVAAWWSRPVTPSLVLGPGDAGESGEAVVMVSELAIGSVGPRREVVRQLARAGLHEMRRLVRFVSESGAGGVVVGLVSRRGR